MNWKEIARDYFSFTRRERIGLLTIIIIILALLFFPAGLPAKHPQQLSRLADLSDEKKTIIDPKKLPSEDSTTGTGLRNDDGEFQPGLKNKHSMFYFDPNTAGEMDWRRLGLKDRTIRTILNYIKKGGRFKASSDLQRIYGLDPVDYRRLAPFVRIPEVKPGPVFQPDYSANARPFDRFEKRKINQVEINLADTSALIALPGIGSKLAQRIIAFRDKLGGFYSLSQVAETFGLPDSTFQKIRKYLSIKGGSFRTININEAGIDQLREHPYIRMAIARTLIAYREEHGPFHSIGELRKVTVITEDIFNKISPYLVLQ